MCSNAEVCYLKLCVGRLLCRRVKGAGGECGAVAVDSRLNVVNENI